MSADAMTRLREELRRMAPDYSTKYGVSIADLRALLDAHTEALDALEPLYRKTKLREGYCPDTTCPHCNELRAAETVLAKAGRR